MSVQKPEAPAVDDGFTPEEAEAVIRRAVRIHERTSEAVSIEDLKQTLASLGVAPEAVERAAAELRSEMKEVSKIQKPTDVMAPLAAVVFFASPAVALLFYREVGGMQGWLVVGFSLLLAAGALTRFAGKLFMWWVARRVRARG